VTPIDPESYQTVKGLLAWSQTSGQDPVEVLHRNGLVMTPDLAHRLKVEALEGLHKEMVSWRPAEFLRSKYPPSHTASPKDMYICIVEWLEKVISVTKEQT